MLTLLNAEQTRLADKYTIESKKIESIDLMEAAAKAFVKAFESEFPDKKLSVSIYCGTGNNGGDGLAIARLLYNDGYLNVKVKIASFNSKPSNDCQINLDRLNANHLEFEEIDPGNLQEEQAEIIIDALLGSGLNKPLAGPWKKLADHLNAQNKTVIAVDIPTGFTSDGAQFKGAAIVKADLTITFQRPKISFFFPESAQAQSRFKIVDIGLDHNFIQSQSSDFQLIEEDDIRKFLKPRATFSHKGNYGHALILAGNPETMGAALLCADACLHTGAGLTTACIPEQGLTALNVRSPEVMALIRAKGFKIPAFEKYNAIAAGPGLGTKDEAKEIVTELIKSANMPLVLDADALNIVSSNPELLNKLPPGSIITPHMKEFDRLFGDHDNWWDRVQTAKHQAGKLNINIVLKNRYSFIVTAKKIFINPTGSPAMATGGMGDVLTGMIVSFIAQGYSAEESAILAAYIHGLCGEKGKGHVYPASELVRIIPEVIKLLLP